MSTFEQSVSNLNASARKVYGKDSEVMVARCPAFGSKDVCFVVRGANRGKIAIDLMRFMVGGKVTERSDEFMGLRSVSTVVEGKIMEFTFLNSMKS